MKRFARAAAIGVAIFALGLIILAMGFGDSLIFFPEKHPGGLWFLPPGAEDATFAAADGAKLHGWFVRPPEAKVAILFAHGNGGNITHRSDHFAMLRDLPAAVLMFDYRGYGRSEGTPDEAGVCADARAAYDWLVAKGFPPERIVVYGESLGGGVAVDLASKVPVGGLVIQCSFTSIKEMVRHIMPLVPIGGLVKTKFASVDKIGAIRCPKLHFHGGADEVVPVHLGRKLFDAAAEPKRWVEYPEMTHNEWPGRRSREWSDEVKRFVDEIAGR